MSKSSKSISIIVTIEVSLALMPFAITVPASTTAPSSTLSSDTLGSV